MSNQYSTRLNKCIAKLTPLQYLAPSSIFFCCFSPLSPPLLSHLWVFSAVAASRSSTRFSSFSPSLVFSAVAVRHKISHRHPPPSQPNTRNQPHRWWSRPCWRLCVVCRLILGCFVDSRRWVLWKRVYIHIHIHHGSGLCRNKKNNVLGKCRRIDRCCEVVPGIIKKWFFGYLFYHIFAQTAVHALIMLRCGERLLVKDTLPSCASLMMAAL